MRNERFDLERLDQALTLKLVEAAVLAFDYRGRNRHSFNRIFLVLESPDSGSEIRNHSGGEQLPMRAGYLYFMPSQCDLSFRFLESMKFVSFHIHLEFLGHIELFAGCGSCMVRPDGDELGVRARRLLESSGEPLIQLFELRQLVLAAVAAFLPGPEGRWRALDAVVRRHERVLEFIRREGSARTTIEELAAVAGVSRSTFSRNFAAELGIPPKQYLAETLIRRAELLLLEPGATARRVAQELQFGNEYYFSRFFKQRTGRTPGEYRRGPEHHGGKGGQGQ